MSKVIRNLKSAKNLRIIGFACIFFCLVFVGLMFREGHKYQSFWLGLFSAHTIENYAQAAYVLLVAGFVFALLGDKYEQN